MVFDSREIEIIGRPVQFTIGTEEGEADIRPVLLDRLNVARIVINPNLAEPEGKLGRLWTALFWIVSKAGYEGVPYDEFMASSDQYPINSLRGAGEFRLSEVNEVRYMLVDWSDPRFGNAGTVKFRFDFDRTNGVFSAYRSIPPANPIYDVEYYQPYLHFREHGLEQAVGALLIEPIPLFANQRNVAEREIFALIDQVRAIADDPKSSPGETIAQSLSRFLRYGFWSIEWADGF